VSSRQQVLNDGSRALRNQSSEKVVPARQTTRKFTTVQQTVLRAFNTKRKPKAAKVHKQNNTSNTTQSQEVSHMILQTTEIPAYFD